MRWLAAAVAIGLLGCSVYDDALLRAGATPNATLVGPPAAGAVAPAVSTTSTTSTPSAGSAAPSSAAPTEPLAADGGESACVKDAGSDYCAQLPALPEPAAIDGVLECGLVLAPIAPSGWKGPGDAPYESASYAAAWTPEGLYLYVEVHGASVTPHPPEQPIFCGDAVELFVDSDAVFDDTGAYDMSGTMQFVIAAPAAEAGATMDAQRFVQGKPQGAWVTPALRVSARADGYSVETLIGASDLGLWQWSPTQQLGFSIGLDLAPAPGAAGPSPSGCAEQAGQFFLRVTDPHGDCDGGPWCDARAFCSTQLL